MSAGIGTSTESHAACSLPFISCMCWRSASRRFHELRPCPFVEEAPGGAPLLVVIGVVSTPQLLPGTFLKTLHDDRRRGGLRRGHDGAAHQSGVSPRRAIEADHLPVQ